MDDELDSTEITHATMSNPSKGQNSVCWSHYVYNLR